MKVHYGLQTGAAFMQGMMDAYTRQMMMTADINKAEREESRYQKQWAYQKERHDVADQQWNLQFAQRERQFDTQQRGRLVDSLHKRDQMALKGETELANMQSGMQRWYTMSPGDREANPAYLAERNKYEIAQASHRQNIALKDQKIADTFGISYQTPGQTEPASPESPIATVEHDIEDGVPYSLPQDRQYTGAATTMYDAQSGKPVTAHRDGHRWRVSDKDGAPGAFYHGKLLERPPLSTKDVSIDTAREHLETISPVAQETIDLISKNIARDFNRTTVAGIRMPGHKPDVTELQGGLVNEESAVRHLESMVSGFRDALYEKDKDLFTEGRLQPAYSEAIYREIHKLIENADWNENTKELYWKTLDSHYESATGFARDWQGAGQSKQLLPQTMEARILSRLNSNKAFGGLFSRGFEQVAGLVPFTQGRKASENQLRAIVNQTADDMLGEHTKDVNQMRDFLRSTDTTVNVNGDLITPDRIDPSNPDHKERLQEVYRAKAMNVALKELDRRGLAPGRTRTEGIAENYGKAVEKTADLIEGIGSIPKNRPLSMPEDVPDPRGRSIMPGFTGSPYRRPRQQQQLTR